MNTVQKAIQQRIDKHKSDLPFGEPVIALPPDRVLVDRDESRIYITMKALQDAFAGR